ncbi:enoyl-CoA hydratase family protein [Actinomadura craniellae]|uniref:Enoyl-CoA hydratase family protein n=1 Tax=Actinomadura craniellae TaxID=2231787 RepID=A0A365H675_9ACTN|nr:enoyl-CoA hydratase family protein [Actinomadura craniellae]RAY13743.1 enoyl-CoA hydratase family protein [Actinomadura craniellae]
MAEEFVRYAVERGVAVITLDSPHNRNALSSRLMAGVERSLAEAADDPTVRAAVLTHTGGTFCAGADLSEVGTAGTGPDRILALLRAIAALPKPVVAKVDGHVRAGGLGLVGACDIAVAGGRSTFAFTESRIGVTPAIISLTTLPRLSDRAAGRYFLTGETFDAAEAARIGLVTEAADDVEGAVEALLAELRACSPQGLAESKRLLSAGLVRSLDVDGPAMGELSARLFASEEAAEGMRAFLERRPPRWAS